MPRSSPAEQPSSNLTGPQPDTPKSLLGEAANRPIDDAWTTTQAYPSAPAEIPGDWDDSLINTDYRT
jgi:hypothetical protein